MGIFDYWKKENRPGDTLYVAVKTAGSAPTAPVAAHWSYEDGQRISQSTQTIALSGPAVIEFHVIQDGRLAHRGLRGGDRLERCFGRDREAFKVQ